MNKRGTSDMLWWTVGLVIGIGVVVLLIINFPFLINLVKSSFDVSDDIDVEGVDASEDTTQEGQVYRSGEGLGAGQILDPKVNENFLEISKSTAEQYGVPSCLLLAIVQQESKGDNMAIGTSGEAGIMQIMPQTALDLGLKIYDPDNKIKNTPRSQWWSSSFLSYLRSTYVKKLKILVANNKGNLDALKEYDDRFDSQKNMEAGARLLSNMRKSLKSTTGTEYPYGSDMVIGAYNAGTGAIAKGNIPTKYVDGVKSHMGQLCPT